MRSMIQDKEPPPSYIVLKGASSLGSRRLDKEGKRGTATGSSVDFLPSIQSSSNEMASQEKVESSPGQWTFLDEEVEEQQERACFLRGLLFGLYICLSIGLSFGVPLLSSDSPPRACFIGIFVSLSFVTLGYLGYLYDRCVQTQLKLVKIHAKASCASISKKNRQRYQQPNRNTYAENYEVSKKDEQSETERAPSPAKHTASHQSDSRSKDDLRGSFSQVGGTDEAERGGKASPNEDRVMPIKEASFSAKRRISLSSTASPASGSVSKGTSYPSCSFMTARSVPLKRYLCDELNNIIIQGSSSGPSSTSSPTLKRPIAESFTNATVLVAHISGFTAFCSERDASQVRQDLNWAIDATDCCFFYVADKFSIICHD